MTAAPGPRIAAVLLAAGESRRMGGIDKRRLTIDGVPLVRRWLALFAAAGIFDVVVVLGHAPERTAALLAGCVVRLVRNDAWAEGQQGSVLAGLRAVPAQADGAMVVLCDLPLVDADDLRALLARFSGRAAGVDVIVPVHDGQRGNPVLVSAAAIAQALADPQGRGLRAFIDAHPERVQRVPVTHDHHTFDLDTPADIERLEQRLGKPVGRGDGPS